VRSSMAAYLSAVPSVATAVITTCPEAGQSVLSIFLPIFLPIYLSIHLYIYIYTYIHI
jgi:hypothetical protein